MRKTHQIVISGVLAAGLMAACSSQDALSEGAADADEASVVEERYGALSAEFVYPRSTDDEGVDVQAQFLDARGVPVDSALEALEVWMPRRGLEMESCQLSTGSASAPAGHEPVSLHLLDVGEIDVMSPQDTLTLEPRRLPDLLSSFYGVVYGSEWSDLGARDFVEYYPGSDYRFIAPGSAQAGAFDVTLQAPDPIVLLAANGEEIRDETVLSVAADEALELVWASDDGVWSTEEVFIDLSAGYGPDQTRIQCRARDHGAFSVSASRLRELSQFSDEVDLEIRRVRSGEAAIEGLDKVDFYFATTDKIELHFD